MPRISMALERIRFVEHLVSLYVLVRLSRQLRRRGLWNSLRDLVGALFVRLRNVPLVGNILDQQMEKEVDNIRMTLLGNGDPDAISVLPDVGLPADAVLSLAKTLKGKETGLSTGKKWAGIYYDTSDGTESDLAKMQSGIWGLFNSTNSLYPGIFPSVRKFEAEIVSMAVHLLHGRRDQVGGVKGVHAEGLLSSGGTESILLAVLAYREMATEIGIESPEIICCMSAHPALDKACHYFGVKLVKVLSDPSTQRLTPENVRAAVTDSTIAVYASAPTFTHGVVDPIEDLAALCRSYRSANQRYIGLHVDNCLGGILLSCMQELGLYQDQLFDFRVDGVTSISIDIHKYGYASKGVSVIAFADNKLRRLSYVPVIDGPSVYVTPTLQGSRSGATMAAAWATLVHKGRSGYLQSAAKLTTIHRSVCAAVDSDLSPGVRVLCTTHLAIVPIVPDPSQGVHVDILVVSSELAKRGWNMFTSKGPDCMSVCVGERFQDAVLESWIADLREVLKFLSQNPNTKVEGDAAIYGAVKNIPDQLVKEVLRSYCEVALSVKHADP